jgi:hypothetical protein
MVARDLGLSRALWYLSFTVCGSVSTSANKELTG